MLEELTLERILEVYRDGVGNRGGADVTGPTDATEPAGPTGQGRPRVTVAGGGEPLIHRRALPYLRRLVAEGFATTLITNASRLTPDLTEALVETGLAGICVSFWGIEEEEYERAMRLPFRATLEKVEALAEGARAAGVPLVVLWVRSPEITSDSDAIRRFWTDRGIEVDTDDNEMWNRGGLLPGGNNAGHAPDLERRVWCSDLYFSDAYNWAGDCLLCCCNYFTHQQIQVGNILEVGPEEIARRKGEILRRRPIPEMCRDCRLPRDRRGAWLAGPILNRLSQEEREMLTDYPSAAEKVS
jgi:hypothetical protein